MESSQDFFAKIKDWAVWIPIATALAYFYSWIFEYVTCMKWHIPSNLIEPSLGSILFYVGVLIFFVTTSVLLFASIYVLQKNAFWRFAIISFFILIVLTNAGFIINNWTWTLEDGKRMSLIGLSIWGVLFVFEVVIHIFSKYDTWNKIFNWMLTDGTEQLKAFPAVVRKYCLPSILVTLLVVTWLTALAYVWLNPPDTRIFGKEPLVIVKKYGDVIICRYLDTTRNHLKDSVKIMKLGGGEGLLTETIKPAPSN